jgi:hypothetical protein
VNYFQKVIKSHVVMGLLCVPVQLFAAAPPPLPPPIAAENIEKVEKVEKVEQAESPELKRRESSVSRETPRSSETEAPSRIPTALAQTGAGLVGGLGSALVGLLLGVMVCGQSSSSVQGFPLPGECIIFAGVAGYGLGTSISVWAVGRGWAGTGHCSQRLRAAR